MENINIALLCTIFGFGVSFLTFNRNSKKDVEENAKAAARRDAQLEYISRGIDDIKFNDRIRDEQLKTMDARLTIVENETKTLFKAVNRLDSYHHGKEESERKGE